MRTKFAGPLVAVALAAGAVLASAHVTHTGAVLAAPAHLADPCAISFPDSAALRGLAVGSGPMALTSLSSGAATFTFGHYTRHNLNADIKRLFGIALPKNDVVGPFTLTLGGAAQTYFGLLHVIHHRTRQHVCLRGIAYRNLGNGMASESLPPTRLYIDGTFASGNGAVDIRVGRHVYALKGQPIMRVPM
jgi:hypothetical protein